MKNWTALKLLTLFALLPSLFFAQVSENLKNLGGNWYQDTRHAITYSNWQNMGNQTLENRTFTIVCGDTTEMSRASIHFTDEAATLYVHTEGQIQTYRLTQSSNKKLVWDNEHPTATPKHLEWIFASGGYASFITDGLETTYRRQSKPLFKLRFRAALGANMNQYVNPVSSNRFLANHNVAAAHGETQMLPGTEASLSVGLLFPTAPMGINFEMGMAYRQVGIQGGFYNSKTATFSIRDGYYRNYNYYLGIFPEFFIGKKRDLSLTAGYYANVFQQRYFRGNAVGAKADTPNFYDNPGRDLDFERGFMLGLHYRVTTLQHLRPQIYLRYTHGLNMAQTRALSLGFAVELNQF